MIFRFVFLFLSIAALGCLMSGLAVKRRNKGYLVVAALVSICDLTCFVLLGSSSVNDVKRILPGYYICYLWIFLAVLWTIYGLGRYRGSRLTLNLSALICLYQTAIVAADAFGLKVMTFSKHILLGRTWWVAYPASNAPVYFSMYSYRILELVNILMIMYAIVSSAVRSDRLFRGKYVAMGIMQLLVLVIEIFTVRMSWPVWIQCLLFNILCVTGHYYVNIYSTHRLREWSLMSFANDMSDGFILYDEHNDLVHMNNMIRDKLPAALTDTFSDRSSLEHWISDTVVVDNMDVLECNTDTGVIYFKTWKTELGRHGYVIGTIYVLHDTTESILRMRAMEQVNRELESAAKMKSDFLANMSHEIRTPMNAVIGMAEIALREKLSPNVRDYLLQIQRSGRSLLNIINDILDFSKIEAGKMEIITDRYEPVFEINDIAGILVTRIGDKNIELFVDLDTDIPHALEGDAMRIRQVIINLANNAIKFTKEGIVCIKVSCEWISEDQVEMIYHVIDTGQGIKEEDIDKLFVSFQQVDSKRNRSVEGTGLGLAISQRLCEAMGGSIGVSSRYGEGSDFYFRIPQRVMDATRDLVVRDAGHKHAFCINARENMTDKFIAEISKLGVSGEIVPSLDGLTLTGEKDYLFFEPELYDDRMHAYLDEHPKLTGIILVNYDSDFESAQDNLRIMKRPETTLGIITILNDSDFMERSAESMDTYEIDYTAPDARILVVDDNVINITIAEGLLKPLNVYCDSALSGMEAIDKLKAESYDIILMDHMMPEMDGIETTHVIRESIPSADKTPIIALTANVMEGVHDMFIKEGMDDYIGKPIDIRVLVEKLRHWLPDEKIIHGAPAQSGDINEADEADIVYEGLNTDEAVRVMGSKSLYHKIVKEYYRSGEDRYADISRAYEAEDWADYTIKVHALKSSSRQIGAYELGDMAERLEQAGNDRDTVTITDRTAEMLDAFKKLLDSLSVHFETGEDEAAGRPLIAADKLADILNELSRACDELDIDAMEQVKAELMSYSYPDPKAEIVDKLCKAIDNIDTDSCMELADKLGS